MTAWISDNQVEYIAFVLVQGMYKIGRIMNWSIQNNKTIRKFHSITTVHFLIK
jgi:hypothetical protein